MQEYKLIKHIAVLSSRPGKTKEVNVISYDGKPPVLDIRIWKQPGMVYTSKGITFDADEIRRFTEAADAMLEGLT